jgi:TrmH family RNA methyltransferase
MYDISSERNEVFRKTKFLGTKKGRDVNKEFIVEGISSVEEVINSSYMVSEIFLSYEFINKEKNKDFIDRLSNFSKENHIKIYKLPDKLFKKISNTETPQGVLSVIKQKNLDYINIINEEKDKNKFIIICEEIQDPGNLGTIIRSAHAFGVDLIVLTKGCVNPFNPKVIRSTMGSFFNVPVCIIENMEDIIKFLKEKNIKTFATSLYASNYLNEVDLNKSLAFIIGNEAKGVTEETMILCEEKVKIHMPGDANSLNVSVAAGIIMYEISRNSF